jgi:hypothetical protein
MHLEKMRCIAHGAGAALEINVLARERRECSDLARALTKKAHPERNRLTTHEHDRAIRAEWLKQPKDAPHLLVAKGRLCGHRPYPSEREAARSTRAVGAKNANNSFSLRN